MNVISIEIEDYSVGTDTPFYLNVKVRDLREIPYLLARIEKM
jgi:hypothetical protein